MALRALQGKVLTGCALAAITAVVLATLVSVAWAGEYHVYACRTPTGQVAPTDGWSAPEEHPIYDPTLNTCAAGGGLIAALNAGYAHASDSATDKASWAFDAPSDEAIAEATLWRAGNTLGGATTNASYTFWFSGGAATGLNARIFGECAAGEGCPSKGNVADPMAEENRLNAPGGALGSSYLAMSTYCGSFVITSCPTDEGDKITYAAMVELFAADLVLSQPVGPTVSAVGGGLAEDSTVEGTSDIAFHAADPGSGVYEALISVDGEVVSRRVLNENGGRCRNVGGTSDGLPAFLYTQPCPPSLSADLPFDTTTLSNGIHHLLVTVTDAAGNAATVLDRELAVDNPATSPACGAGAPVAGQALPEPATLSARWRGTASARLRGPYGVSRTVEGLLAGAGGVPIADAPLEVCELPSYAGASARVLATPHTDAAGRWSLQLPRGLSSCELLVAYRRHPADALPAATRSFTLTVPAALRLRVTPRSVAPAGAIDFSGRLAGGPIPAGGVELVLEARSPGGRWLEFHVIRTGARGRLHYRYRFRLPGPIRYQFRALYEHAPDFPFAASASNVVGVFER
jgi:hypothetical protein